MVCTNSLASGFRQRTQSQATRLLGGIFLTARRGDIAEARDENPRPGRSRFVYVIAVRILPDGDPYKIPSDGTRTDSAPPSFSCSRPFP
jgi:hypothetical protein